MSELILEYKQQLADSNAAVMHESDVAESYRAEADNLHQQLSDHIKREVMLREALETCEVGDFSTGHVIYPSFDEKLVNEALAATADLDCLILCHAEPCRDDGRCQYAIDHGAEGLGHCPEGKCCMPLYRAWEPK